MKTMMVMMVVVVAMVGCVAAEQATVQIQMNSHNGIVSNTAVVDGQTIQVYPDGSSETVTVEAGRTIIVVVPCGNGMQPEQMTVEVVRGLNVVRPQGQANPTAQGPVPTPVVVPVVEPVVTPVVTPAVTPVVTPVVTPEPTPVVEHVDNGNHVGTGGVNDDRKNPTPTPKPTQTPKPKKNK